MLCNEENVTPSLPAEPAHHPYGPSRWTGLATCPGYAPTQGGDPEFRERGTAVHEALETGDFSKLREEDRATAEWMRDEVRKLTFGLDPEREVRTRIPAYMASPLAPVGGVFGTCDLRWNTEDGSLHIGDYKAFSKVGMTDYSPQLSAYALGSERPITDRVVFHVFHGGSRVVETIETDWDSCVREAEKVAFAISHPDAARCRSQHCEHCKNAPDCPESAKVVAFGTLAAGRLTREAVRADPANAARLCDWIDAAMKRLEEARAIVAACAKEDGISVEDPACGIRYEVQRSKGKARVPPVSEIIDRLIDEDGVKRESVLARATVTVTALAELVGKARAEEYAVRGEDVVKFVRKAARKELKG